MSTTYGNSPKPYRAKVIACATVIEEVLPRLPADMAYQTLDFGLHVNPHRLRETLQAAIDTSSSESDTLLLGYGLCSQAVIGLHATDCTLVVPKVDDCIAIFLGSLGAYRQQSRSEPGSYYLTKGWIEVGDTPFAEYDRMLERYGREKADRIIRIMLANYKRVALINTGQYDLDYYREYTQGIAGRFHLRYDEVPGSPALVEKMLSGNWDSDFVVVPPGGTVELSDFFGATGMSTQ